MILTLEKLEKDLEALSKLLKEDPEKLWEKVILKEGRGGDDTKVTTFEVALSSLPINEYGQKIYSNAMTFGGKDKEVDMQKVDSYLPKVFQKLRSNTPYEFFEKLAGFMDDPVAIVGDAVIPAREATEGRPRELNVAEQMGFSFSALLAYKILLETFVNFEASPAGKILEFITAGLVGGYVESDTEITDFVGGDGVHYSLKFLKPNAKYEGSLISLYQATQLEEGGDEDKKRRIIYLTMAKTLDNQIANFDRISLDKLRESKIGINFLFFEVDIDKVERRIFTDPKNLKDIVGAIAKNNPEDFQSGIGAGEDREAQSKGKYYDLFTKIKGATGARALRQILDEEGVTEKDNSEYFVQELDFSLETLRNIKDLKDVVVRVQDLASGLSNSELIKIPIPLKIINQQIKDLETIVDVVNNPREEKYKIKPKSGSNLSAAKKKEKGYRDSMRSFSREIRSSKAFKEIERTLKDAKRISLGNALYVTKPMLVFFMGKNTNFDNFGSKEFINAKELASRGAGVGENQGLFVEPEPDEVARRIKKLQDGNFIREDISSEEINLLYRLFHLLRGFAMQKKRLDFNPRFKTSEPSLPPEASDFENYVREKLLDPKIKGISKKKVVVLQPDGTETREDDDSPFSKAIHANIKSSRDHFFVSFCKPSADMPPIRMEFSSDKFVETFEKFEESYGLNNKIILNAVKSICSHLTAFNKNFRESLTEGLTFDSLDSPLESLAGLTQNWNTMARRRAKQGDEDKGRQQ